MTFKTKAGTELPISNLRGKDYLEVKYRLVWFREEHPDWAIETELIEMSDQHCVAKAVVKNQEGKILSTGHKHEDREGFADYREKSETGAIGRALAHIGYGTQFAPELEEGERLADSPIERKPRLASVGPKDEKICDCGNPMIISLYGTEPRPWYCGKCKKRTPRKVEKEKK